EFDLPLIHELKHEQSCELFRDRSQLKFGQGVVRYPPLSICQTKATLVYHSAGTRNERRAIEVSRIITGLEDAIDLRAELGASGDQRRRSFVWCHSDGNDGKKQHHPDIVHVANSISYYE